MSGSSPLYFLTAHAAPCSYLSLIHIFPDIKVLPSLCTVAWGLRSPVIHLYNKTALFYTMLSHAGKAVRPSCRYTASFHFRQSQDAGSRSIPYPASCQHHPGGCKQFTQRKKIPCQIACDAPESYSCLLYTSRCV